PSTTDIYTLSLHALFRSSEILFPVGFGSSGSNEGANLCRAEEQKVSAEIGVIHRKIRPFRRKIHNLSKILTVDEVEGENHGILSDRKSTRLNSSHVETSY